MQKAKNIKQGQSISKKSGEIGSGKNVKSICNHIDELSVFHGCFILFKELQDEKSKD